MIVRFSLENWMSFRNEATLSMVASREIQHKLRIPKVDRYALRILPVAALYGGNASGKTNFFEAISFVKNFVVTINQPDSLIPIERFLLDNQDENIPTRFCIELLIGETIYDFSFSVTLKKVVEEKLLEITASGEKLLYERCGEKFDLGKSVAKNADEGKFIRFAFQGTRDNQLFLTNAVSQKVETFLPIYNWFRNTLVLIAPNSKYANSEQLCDEAHPLCAKISSALSQLDTGIAHIGGEDYQFENFHEVDKNRIREILKEGTSIKLDGGCHSDSFIVTKKNGEFITKKFVAYHAKLNGAEATFGLHQESDGTRRIIEILPAFMDMSSTKSRTVYVIDEIDRSLHTLLTRQLIEAYLSSCSTASRAQLLFTTHDALLMDQKMLRRDEIWVAERDSRGISSLCSFSEYKDVRKDKDIRKSYLLGRLGGVPRLLLGGAFKTPTPDNALAENK